MRNKWIYLLVALLLFGCYSNKNKTEERAKQRITEFIQLALTDHWEEAEAYLSNRLIDSETKEIFLSNFDNWQLKDTANVVIEFQEIYIPENDPRQRALASMTIRNVENIFTKMASMPIIFERGDWYIGQ
jgi:predicted RNase H-like HicB family nuclease